MVLSFVVGTDLILRIIFCKLSHDVFIVALCILETLNLLHTNEFTFIL